MLTNLFHPLNIRTYATWTAQIDVRWHGIRISRIQSCGAFASQSACAPREEFYERGLEGTDSAISRRVGGGERANRPTTRQDDGDDEARDGAHRGLVGPRRAGPQGARTQVLQAVSQHFLTLKGNMKPP